LILLDSLLAQAAWSTQAERNMLLGLGMRAQPLQPTRPAQ